MLIPYSNIKKEYLQILKNLTQFFCSYPLQILRILKNTSFYTNNNLHKNYYANNSHKNYCKHKAKYIITACILIILLKKIYFFSLLYIRMNGSNINFDNKKIEKSDFYNENKKIFNIDDIDVNKY